MILRDPGGQAGDVGKALGSLIPRLSPFFQRFLRVTCEVLPKVLLFCPEKSIMALVAESVTTRACNPTKGSTMFHQAVSPVIRACIQSLTRTGGEQGHAAVFGCLLTGSRVTVFLGVIPMSNEIRVTVASYGAVDAR